MLVLLSLRNSMDLCECVCVCVCVPCGITYPLRCSISDNTYPYPFSGACRGPDGLVFTSLPSRWTCNVLQWSQLYMHKTTEKETRTREV